MGGSLDARVGDAIRVLVDEGNKLRRGRSKWIMDVRADPGTGRMDERSIKVDWTKEGMDEIEMVFMESGGAFFPLLMQLTDGEAKSMLMGHAGKKMKNGVCSILELNKSWDPQARTGKLAALVDLVTPSSVDHPEKFMGKLRNWEARIVEANKSHQVVLQFEIKTAIFHGSWGN